MEVHVPEGPTHSIRDFLIHIFIVTVGILIALGLDSIRETIHEHRIVREARENFQAELRGNKKNIELELENVLDMQKQLDQIVTDLPNLRQHPELMAGRVAAMQPSFYFFSNTRWQTALSTGALGHMKSEEVDRYASEEFGVRAYSSFEAQTSPAWIELESFFAARPRPSPADVDLGVEKLLILRSDIGTLRHVGEQLQGSIDEAIKNEKK